MLEVRGLACAHHERTLFSGVSFSLASGQWLHVRGENGAGKTSLLRVLVGLAHAEVGEVHWAGERVPSARFREDTLYHGHPAAVKEEQTPLENLRTALAIDDVPADDATILRALGRLGLRGREELPVRVLSAGQKRRVLLARLLLRPAKLWVLDEAFNALDTAAVTLLGALIGEHLAVGGLAVLTSHQPLPLPGGEVLTL